MDEFDKLLKEYGEPQRRTIVTEEEAHRYADKVPKALVKFWLEHGRGSYESGKTWICDPAFLQPIVRKIFLNDADFEPDNLIPVYRQAFGGLTIWDCKTKRHLTVDFISGDVVSFGADSWIDQATGMRLSDDSIIGAILYRQKFVEAWVSDNDEDMMPLAIEKCGLLDHDEMYGFFPAIQLGGDNTANNIKKIKAVEHLLILIELTDFRLIRTIFSNPTGSGGYRREIIRFIGSG